MTDVKVEQCDKEAAKAFWNGEMAGWREQSERQAALILAFARHRQAAEKATRERDAGIVKAHPMRFAGMTEQYIRERIATAIRSQNDD